MVLIACSSVSVSCKVSERCNTLYCLPLSLSLNCEVDGDLPPAQERIRRIHVALLAPRVRTTVGPYYPYALMNTCQTWICPWLELRFVCVRHYSKPSMVTLVLETPTHFHTCADQPNWNNHSLVGYGGQVPESRLDEHNNRPQSVRASARPLQDSMFPPSIVCEPLVSH